MSRIPFLHAGLTTLAALALFAARPADAQIKLAFTNIDVPSAATGPKDNYAGGISSSGNNIVIDQYINPTDVQNGYLLSNGTYTLKNHPGTGPGVYTALTGVNSSGTILGQYFQYGNNGTLTIDEDYVETSGGTITKLLTHDNATLTAFNSIGENGKVAVTWIDTNGLRHASVYDPATATYTDIPNVVPGKNSVATLIAPNGDVLVSYRDANNARRAALYDISTGQYTRYIDPLGAILDPLGIIDPTYYGINSSGLVLGEYTKGGRDYAFLFDGTTVTDASLPDALDLRLGYGLTESGQFVGYYTSPADSPLANGNRPAHSFLASPVPEPGSIAFLVTGGLSGAAFLRRRRKLRKTQQGNRPIAPALPGS